MSKTEASVFIIGTELTRGIIQDSHTQRIAAALTQLGMDVRRSVIVPDDGSIAKMLDVCLLDSDVVVITGGLGPTSDDMTRRVIADAAGVPLVLDQGAWDELYRRVGERIHGANEIQAYFPRGFRILANPFGTAPGFMGTVCRSGRTTTVCCLPGPPAEMQPMFFDRALPELARLYAPDDTGRDEYSVFLVAEAKLEELCASCRREGVIWGTRFQRYKVALYLAGGSVGARREMAEDLRRLIGEDLFLNGDVDAADLLCDLLKKEKYTISTAESCTSGWVAKLLTDRSGASEWFRGGACVYSQEAKIRLAGVPEDILETDGVYSPECAASMAEGIRKSLGSTLGAGITGIAGPDGGSPENPVGTVYFGFSAEGMQTQAVRLVFSSPRRDFIRLRSSVACCILARMYLEGRCLLDRTSCWSYI